jgi:hypothetical protein
MLPGVSARGLSEIARLERRLLGLGAAAEALGRWERFARASRSERDELVGCRQPSCCPDPHEDREVLARVLGVLPSGDRASLQRRLEKLDDAVAIRDADASDV